MCTLCYVIIDGTSVDITSDECMIKQLNFEIKSFSYKLYQKSQLSIHMFIKNDSISKSLANFDRYWQMLLNFDLDKSFLTFELDKYWQMLINLMKKVSSTTIPDRVGPSWKHSLSTQWVVATLMSPPRYLPTCRRMSTLPFSAAWQNVPGNTRRFISRTVKTGVYNYL